MPFNKQLKSEQNQREWEVGSMVENDNWKKGLKKGVEGVREREDWGQDSCKEEISNNRLFWLVVRFDGSRSPKCLGWVELV